MQRCSASSRWLPPQRCRYPRGPLSKPIVFSFHIWQANVPAMEGYCTVARMPPFAAGIASYSGIQCLCFLMPWLGMT